MTEPTCYECRYWDKVTSYPDKRNSGLCRIHPPVRNDTDHDDWGWPVTYDEDWCGKWQSREEPPPTSSHATRYIVHPDDVGKEGPGIYRRMIPVEEEK